MVEQITSGDKNAQFWRLRHKILKSCGSAGGMLLGHMQIGAARAFMTRRADTEACALGHRRATKFRPSRACFPAAKIPMVTARKAACAKYRRLDPASKHPQHRDGQSLMKDENSWKGMLRYTSRKASARSRKDGGEAASQR